MLAREEVLPSLLADRAARTPDRVFVRNVGGDELTYAQLEAEIQSWLALLGGEGVTAGDRVVVMLPNTKLLPIWMAIARLGAIEVPVNTAYRGKFLEHVLLSSGARYAVVAPEFADRFAALGDALGECRTIVLTEPVDVDLMHARAVTADLEAMSGQGHSVPPVEPGGYHPAAILYTSGTTGASKGAIVSWEQIYKTAEACPPWHDLSSDDVRYSPFPMFHMSGKLAVYSAAVLDGEVVIRNGFSTSEFWRDIDRYGCTTSLLIGATPTFIAKLPPSQGDREHPLRNVLLGPPPDNPIGFCERFGLRASVVFNMTELSCPTSTGWDMQLLERGSVGRLRQGYSMRIVDDADYELPPGEIGEIVVRAEEPWQLMGGYWGMPEKTVEAWRNLWFHTGDLGRMEADGTFYFLDRKKDAIRRRGENISSMELEAEICESDDVAEAAVVGYPSEVGEEDVRAVVVPLDPGSFDPAALIEFLRERVPAFMLPRYITIADALPKTPTEKVKKNELKDWPIDERTWEHASARPSRRPAPAGTT
jgi:crotonobetaine/carnitine-CoA ligase